MNPIIKTLIISLIVGIIGFVIVDYIQHSAVSIPTDAAAISTLVVIVLSVFVGGVLARAGHGESALMYDDEDREMGTVKWFNVKKGYGFITRDQGDDVFVHYRNIRGQGRRAIAEGQRVEFNVISSDKGLQADEVEPV